MGPGRLLCVAWADETWLTARSPEELIAMICELKAAAKTMGLELRLTECKWAEVRRPDQQATPVSRACHELRCMSNVDKASTMRVFGADVHMQAYLELEFAQVLSRTWAAFHMKAPLRRTKGSLHAKLRIKHLSVYASFSWSSGTRHWTAGELQRVETMQVECTDKAWQSAAQDRDTRHAMEPEFLAWVTRVAPDRVAPIPRGRHMLEEPEAELVTDWT